MRVFVASCLHSCSVYMPRHFPAAGVSEGCQQHGASMEPLPGHRDRFRIPGPQGLARGRTSGRIRFRGRRHGRPVLEPAPGLAAHLFPDLGVHALLPGVAVCRCVSCALSSMGVCVFFRFPLPPETVAVLFPSWVSPLVLFHDEHCSRTDARRARVPSGLVAARPGPPFRGVWVF